MTTTDRQQSLANARRAAHFLRLYIQSQIVDERIRGEIACLLEEFTRLDAGEQTRNAAGRKYGKLGAVHGAKGGRPKGSTKKAKKRGKK